MDESRDESEGLLQPLAAWLAAVVLAVILAILWEDSSAVEVMPLSDSLALLGVSQGVLCMVTAAMIAPRRLALATLPALPLVVLATSALNAWHLHSFYVMWGLPETLSIQTLEQYARGIGWFHGATAIGSAAVAGIVAICLLHFLSTRRRRGAMAVVSILIFAGLWTGGGAYFRVLQDQSTQALQPQVTQFVEQNVLQDSGPMKWWPLVWHGRFPHPRFALIGRTSPRSDGSRAGIVMTHIPSPPLNRTLTLGDLDFPVLPKPSTDYHVPLFTVIISRLPERPASQPITPAELAGLGWLRPAFARSLMQNPLAAGNYTTNIAGLRAFYYTGYGTPEIAFYGRYQGDGRGSQNGEGK